jgi:hypothetical protein
MIAATVAAMIEQDQLRDISEWDEGRFEMGVVEAWAAMQQ